MNEKIIEAFGNKLRLRVSGILVRDNEILLVSHKSIGKTDTLWAPPGGGMHFGEPVEECLKREFLEETNLEVKVGPLLFVNEYLEGPLHAIELFFEISDYSGELKIGHDPEMSPAAQIIQNVRFVSFEEIKRSDPLSFHSIFQNINTLAELKNLKGYYKNINLS
jgi:8-oxo-dGTP diphosphatase